MEQEKSCLQLVFTLLVGLLHAEQSSDRMSSEFCSCTTYLSLAGMNCFTVKWTHLNCPKMPCLVYDSSLFTSLLCWICSLG